MVEFQNWQTIIAILSSIVFIYKKKQQQQPSNE